MATSPAGRPRAEDGSTGDADYGKLGAGYANYRQPEPAIAHAITAALGPARRVLNVGSGAGSYEPTDRDVTAVEPSAAMRAQRPAARPAIDAVAEALPFPDEHFDASMTTFSVHQWSQLDLGLSEMRRVTRGPVVVLTCDPTLVQRFWLVDYAPEVLAAEARRFPDMTRIEAGLGGRVEVRPIPIPLRYVDGFNEAYYGRPERLLDAGARLACSAWSFVPDAAAEHAVSRLAADLAGGTWDRQHGHLRRPPHFEGSLVLVISRP